MSSRRLYHAGSEQEGTLVREWLCGVCAMHLPVVASAGWQAEVALLVICGSWVPLAMVLLFWGGAWAGTACGSALGPYRAAAVLRQRLVWRASGSLLRSRAFHVHTGDAFFMLRACLLKAMPCADTCGPVGACLCRPVASLISWFGRREPPAGGSGRKAYMEVLGEPHPYRFCIQCGRHVNTLLVQARW